MDHRERAELTAEIVASYVGANRLEPAALPDFILSVNKALQTLDQPQAAEVDEAPAAKLTAAQIKRSIKADGLVSFIDGKTYKTLRRHLTSNGLTPDQYRTRFGLPADYPMVSASYSAARSEMARKMGLGQAGRQPKKAAAKTPRES